QAYGGARYSHSLDTRAAIPSSALKGRSLSMIKQILIVSYAAIGFSFCQQAAAHDPIDGAPIEIGDDNDADGGRKHVGLINLLDDKDPGTVHDGRGALIEVGPDNNAEDGTLLDLLDTEGLVRLLGNNLLGGLGVAGLLGGTGGTGGLTG